MRLTEHIGNIKWQDIYDRDKRNAELEREKFEAQQEVIRLMGRVKELEARANDAEEREGALYKWRAEVTAAAIHAHEDNEGGLRYDEVPIAIKRLGKRIEELEAEQDKRIEWLEGQALSWAKLVSKLREEINDQDALIKKLENK